jgi:hypothetical protein
VITVLELALIVFVVVVLWVLSLVVRPFGKCFWCKGKGNRRKKGKGKAPKCWLCKGRRRRQRIGSHTVHRVRRQVVRHWRGAE